MRLLFLAVAMLLAACGTTESAATRVRPAYWAQPVVGSEVDNWHVVTPDLHRCAQPSAAGMRALHAFGIKSVVNLRGLHRDADEVAGTDLTLIEVPMGAGSMTYAHLVAALGAVLRAKKPVVVHCWQGADRTGAVVAAWRVAIDGWSAREALDEMVGGGFGHSVVYGNLRELVAGLDRAQLRRDVGLPAAP